MKSLSVPVENFHKGVASGLSLTNQSQTTHRKTGEAGMPYIQFTLRRKDVAEELNPLFLM